MRYIEEYKGTYDASSRDEIHALLKRGRSKEIYSEFVLEEHNVKVVVDYDGLTFDVIDTAEAVQVLIGNKLVIENDDLMIDFLIDYSRDRLGSFEQHREKVAEFVVMNLSREERDRLLISLLATKV